MRRVELLRAAGHLAAIVGPQDCVLVGGLAVGAHGYVRATKDVDFVARSALAAVRERLIQEGIPATVLRGDPLEGDFPCLKATVDGVPVDVMPPLVPIDWEKAIEVQAGRKTRIRVVDLDGLLRLKLRAGGAKDLMDVAALVLRHPEQEERALVLARSYRLEDKLAIWLNDPRLKQDLLETKPARTPARKRRRSRQ